MDPSLSSTYDVIIAGAGLAGSAAATLLARAGWKVALLERDAFPRDKLCGEFLSGEATGYLETLGCLPQLLALNPPAIHDVRFITPQGKSISVPLPRPACGVSRNKLDELLFDNACAAGATGITQCEVRNLRPQDPSSQPAASVMLADGTATDLSAPVIIAAYGRRAAPDKGLHREGSRSKDTSIGLKLHHLPAMGPVGQQAVDELRGITEIFAFQGGYCGISLVDAGRINVCMLLEKTALNRAQSARWVDVIAMLSRENRALGERLAMLRPADAPVQTVAQIPFALKNTTLPGVYFAGDAAGMIAPLCGDGQAMALESGIMLANLLISQGNPDFARTHGSEVEQAWQRQWNKRFKTRMRVGRTLQKMILRPATAELTVTCLSFAPTQLKAWLAQITRS